MARILIIEDEKKLASFLLRGLRAEGYECDWIFSENEIISKLSEVQFDLILLDRLIQNTDSIELIPHIRHKQPNTLILVLTALHDIEDKVFGLRAGADDYLGKPFDFDELLARIEALLRRTGQPIKEGTDLEKGLLRMHPDGQKVWIDEKQLELTNLEFQLLKYFLSNPDSVLSRERILNKVWGNASDPLTNIVDVYIRRLRKKLNSVMGDGAPPECFIETVRGAGYRLGACSNGAKTS